MILINNTFALDFLKGNIRILNIGIMKYSTNNYIAPSIEVFDVTCEVGFLGSTGDLSFTKGEDDGWDEL